MSDMGLEHSARHEKRRDWRTITAWTVVVLVLAALIGYGIAGSYESLSRFAAGHQVPLPRFFPAGVDGGLLGAIILDITLTWMGQPVGFLRQVARLLAMASVGLNAWAGWPDAGSVAGRVFAPVLIVVFAEAVRRVLLRRIAEARADRIPVARWVLATRQTFRLWRRMKLWQVTSYEQAISMELSRLHAVQRLTDKYGGEWRGKVPGALAWMLDAGVRMGDALATVDELCSPPPVPAAASPAPGSRTRTRTRKGSRTRTPVVPVSASDAEAEFMDELSSGTVPSIRQIRARLHTGQARATVLHAHLERVAASVAPATGPLRALRDSAP